jgi:hypothetical protein
MAGCRCDQVQGVELVGQSALAALPSFVESLEVNGRQSDGSASSQRPTRLVSTAAATTGSRATGRVVDLLAGRMCGVATEGCVG